MGRLFRPLGGSGQFSHNIADKFTALGGHIHTSSRVDRIVVGAKGRVEGIVVNGAQELFRADAVIACCDLHTIMHKLLEGRFHDSKADKWLRDMPLFPTTCLVSHCVTGPLLLNGTDAELTIRLREPARLVGAEQIESLWVRVHQQQVAMQPESTPRAVVQTFVMSSFEFWQHAANESREKYEALKEELGKQVIALVAPHLHGIAQSSCNVVHVDVATPMTFQRFTGGWRGSFEGFALQAGRSLIPDNLRSVSGVKQLYLAGQWCNPGGGVLPSATTARDAVQFACHDLHVHFVAPPAAFSE